MSETSQNNAGRVFLANVTIAEAVAFDPAKDDETKPDTWGLLAAKDFDKDVHGDMNFFCPCCLDNGDEVRLKRPTGGHLQPMTFDVVDPNTDEPIIDPATNDVQTITRRYEIPPRYSLYPGQKHSCDLGNQQNDLARTIKDNDGVTLNSASGTYLVNLNIPAGQRQIKRSNPKMSLTEAGTFNNAANPAGTQQGLKRRLHTKSSSAPSGPRSKGAKTVEALAQMLDATQFDQGQREAIILRNGRQEMTLAKTYHDDVVKLYRDLFKTEHAIKDDVGANHNQTSIFQFTPNGNKRFWTREDDGSYSVQSQTKQIRDPKGRKFYVSTKLNFQTDAAFEAFKETYEKATRGDDRSFLVYTENAFVSTFDHENARKRIDNGHDKHGDVHVHAKVFDADQMMKWSPIEPQLTLDFGQNDARKAQTPSHDDTLDV